VINEIYLTVSLVLLITMSLGLIRVVIGPTPADRMMAAQLLGSAGIGMLLLLAMALDVPALIDVALIFGLLAAVAVAAFTRRRVGRDEF
jgi:multicomponent Na+:H+ antiporter subunit F